jgi:hypothetical protein
MLTDTGRTSRKVTHSTKLEKEVDITVFWLYFIGL